MKSLVLLVMFTGWCGAQTVVNGGRDYKGTLKASGSISIVDFTGAGTTAPVKAGLLAARPAACTQGQIYFATDSVAGQNLYFCTATGSPGTWSQMSGSVASTATAGSGAPSGNCTPPAMYVDTANQDLWFCGTANVWKKPVTDLTGLPTLSGANAWTGYNNLAGAQFRPPESTVAALPAAAGNTGKVYIATDAITSGSCSAGGGSARSICRSTGTVWESIGGAAGGVTSIATTCGVAGGTITATGTITGSEAVNAQSGAGAYAIVNGDCGKLVSRNQAAAVSDTIAQAGSGGNFASGWFVDYQCRGAGGCTIAPTVSTIDGALTLGIVQNQGMRIVSDGSNYFTQRGAGVSGTGSVASPFSALHTGFTAYNNPEPSITGTASYTDYSGQAATVYRGPGLATFTEPLSISRIVLTVVSAFTAVSGTPAISALQLSVGTASNATAYLPPVQVGYQLSTASCTGGVGTFTLTGPVPPLYQTSTVVVSGAIPSGYNVSGAATWISSTVFTEAMTCATYTSGGMAGLQGLITGNFTALPQAMSGTNTMYLYLTVTNANPANFSGNLTAGSAKVMFGGVQLQ